MKTKICIKCKLRKDILEFSKNKNSKDGHQSYCKKCIHKYYYTIEHWREYRKNNRKHFNLWSKKYYKKRTETLEYKFLCWKQRASLRHIDFNLSYNDVKSIPMICYYTNKILTLECNQYNTVSLERIDSDKGYVKDNVVFCCGFINLMKRNLTYNQFISSCQLIVDTHKNRNTNYFPIDFIPNGVGV